MNTVNYSPQAGFARNIDSLKGKRVDIALDSVCVSTHQIILPNLSANKAKQAIPFALEDQLLDDIETLEFMSFKGEQEGEWQVIVCAKDTLNEIIDAAKKQKIGINNVYPNFMRLPEPRDAVSFVSMNDGVLYRSGVYQGGWLPTNLFEISFPQAQVQPLNTGSPLVNLIANLNQTSIKKWLQPWFGAVVLAVIWTMVNTTQLWLNNHRLSEQAQALSSQNKATFKQLFPDTKRIVNIQVQAQQKLALAKQQNEINNTDFLTVLSHSEAPSAPLKRLTFQDGKIIGSEQ